ncbi:MAG: rod shape-determining protein MreC [Armatimonadetes bacterium]|nr:rod shape-determining protein MreC [Armatimonadota bacterium]
MDFVSRTAQLVALPVQRAAGITSDWVGDFLAGIWDAPGLKRRIADLEHTLEEGRQDADERELQSREIARLHKLLEMPQEMLRRSAAADVIAYYPSRHRIQLNVGTAQGVRLGHAVIAPDGLVGQVVEASGSTCFVNLVTHPDFSVGARVMRSESQVAGFVRGQGDDELVLEIYPETADAQPDDILATSGLSHTYPEGIRIGRIVQVSLDTNYGIRRGLVQPAVNAAKLREVLVVVR